MPQVLNKHAMKLKDWANAIYVGRGSIYGNPYKVGEHGTREEVIERYRTKVLPLLDLRPLKGKDLVCFCAPLPCHADLLLEKANRPLKSRPK